MSSASDSKRRKLDQQQQGGSGLQSRSQAMTATSDVKARVSEGREGPLGLRAKSPCVSTLYSVLCDLPGWAHRNKLANACRGEVAPLAAAATKHPRLALRRRQRACSCYLPVFALQARRWTQQLRELLAVGSITSELQAVKKGVRGLLEVCKNGEPVTQRDTTCGRPTARSRLPEGALQRVNEHADAC